MRTLAVLLVLCSGLSVARGTTYYVDCQAGSDAAKGTPISEAWRTLARVAATTFLPGDSILLKRGTRCIGQLWPKGSGESQHPIRLGAYGSGPLPIVDAGSADAAIKLFNQQHWIIETLESTGGTRYGVCLSATQGVQSELILRDLVIHDVTGEPKSKLSGLVVVTSSGEANISDVLIDGVMAYNTTQWAGIVISGASSRNRIHNVIVRNSIVHDVYGDGIVLFYVEDGLIERSAAWLTGLQPEETIGTPNAIWTWTCRRCTVRHTEGFFIDSPGVDGGVYDIDFGDEDNIVEENYGHDAMGYCAAVFAAEKQITSNSIVRRNLCIDNGRSPKLARRQGDLFVFTWDGGLLDGVRIEDNTFYWSPPIDVPAFLIDHAQFTGTRPNIVAGNKIFTGVTTPIQASNAFKVEQNIVTPVLPANAAVHEGSGRFRLILTGADRGQLVFLQTALVQYPKRVEAVLVLSNPPADLVHDWNIGRVQLTVGEGEPGLQIVAPSGRVVAQWSGFVSPPELGLALRLNLGIPEPFRAEAASARNVSKTE